MCSLARNALAFSTPPSPSRLIGSTMKSGPSNFLATAARAGISARHGTHQLAQKLTSSVLPAKSLRLIALPFASTAANSPEATLSIAAAACGMGAQPEALDEVALLSQIVAVIASATT